MTDRIPVQPVILCGGSGTRLWPLSRAGFPKQFLALTGDESLFQLAARRVMQLGAPDIKLSAPLIVGGEEHRFLVLEQLREIRVEPAALLLEPSGRNTAPALTLAAMAALEAGQDPVLVATPADQTVGDPAALTRALQTAIRHAASGTCVILGVAPDRPETGYGYICASGTGEMLDVQQFVEKPDGRTAQEYLDQKTYFWNSGIFVIRASVWMEALGHFRPDIAQPTRAAWDRRSVDERFIRPGKDEFLGIPSESVDYAVMEHCPGSAFHVGMVRLDAGWNDLGSWDAAWQTAAKDAAGNACRGDVLTVDSHNNLIHAASRLVSAVGLDDLVIVETADAVLVARRDSSQGVRKIVASLVADNREEHLLHRKVHRPWGWYDGIDQGERFKVKHIQVKPKASLSLQMHHHRAEHWIVVRGTAEIVCGDKTILLSENQSTYIPLGETHRLRNPGTIPLEIIEVQSGSYLGEDDIVRFDDTYGRDTAEK